MALEDDLIGAFELHSVETIQTAVSAGMDVAKPIRGKSAVNWLTEMYTRTDRFPSCLRLLLHHGARLDDPLLEPVLLDDTDALKSAIEANPSLLTHRTNMVSAFTPLIGATLLHVAAEFGCRRACETLIEAGADVNARAATDDFGLNGHTPIFHTVNSNGNRSAPIMRLLIDARADAGLHLAGITWGQGFEWETTFFDVTPVSYAQFGLMPQVHRKEADIYDNIKRLLAAQSRVVPPMENVPNKYLVKS